MGRFQLKHQTVLVSCLLLLAPASLSISQQISPSLLEGRWKARWISSPGGPQREFAVFRFRKSFSMDPVPAHFTVHASGDNRYELFVNGTRVLEGPARGDLDHWRFDTLDIAAHLQPGKNVLAAVVWNFAELAPQAQMSTETGFILQGDGDAEAIIDTDKTWKSFHDSSEEMIPVGAKTDYAYTVVGPGESVDGARYPWGWETRDYDDSSWKDAAELSPGGPRAIQ